MSVVQSGGLRIEIGVLYLSHAMLVLDELIVCSTREFACILAKWFWPTVTSFSLTYGSPEASCKNLADTYRVTPKKYSCLIESKMHNKRGIFKIKIVLNFQ